MNSIPDLHDPHAAARAAHLRYVSDHKPGITRTGQPGAFAYLDPDGHEIKDGPTLDRIRALGIPPAYRDVWICPLANGHLQFTGKDARGRKQYRYHAEWRAVRDAAKYDRMLAFGAALPKIRARVEVDLAQPGLTRTKLLAVVVRLLEKTCIRVGNEEYAQTNDSYGLTTMLAKHVAVHGAEIRFRFRGKSGKEHDVALADKRVAGVLKKCLGLPGEELFQYQAPDGTLHDLHSDDVNAYLHEISSEAFTAKDFRTWAGTLFCALYLAEAEAAKNKTESKRIVKEAIERVSKHLGNTPAICRKCYVHPQVLAAFDAGAMVLKRVGKTAGPVDTTALSDDEKAVLKFLEGRTVE
jgi:DNA topoisomerase-1